MTVRLCRRHEGVSRKQLIEAIQSSSPTLEPAEFGTTKQQFFDVLASVGTAHKMDFSLVFIHGDIALTTAQSLPRNVAICYTSSDRQLRYQTLDYESLFADTAQETAPSDSIDSFLRPRYLAVYRQTPLLTPSPWLAAAGVALVWLTWQFSKARRVRLD